MAFSGVACASGLCAQQRHTLRKSRWSSLASAQSYFQQFSPNSRGGTMLRKLAMQVVCLSVLACLVPAAGAQTFKFVGAGSSAMWQNFALAGYNSGNCPTGGTAPCKHYTGKGFLMHDGRAASIADETGNVWITWDSAA